MTDTEISDLSLVAPVAVLPIQTVAWEAAGLEKCEHEVIQSLEASISHPHEVTQSLHAEVNQQPKHDSSHSLNSDEVRIKSLSTSSSAGVRHTEDLSTTLSPANIHITDSDKPKSHVTNTDPSSSIPSTVSNSPVQQYATATHFLHHPQTKRFTSVNITRRFLEKTSAISGSISGTGSISNTNSALNSSSQRRGISPNSRSPAFDRPVSSRLVTAKLTAVSQPSSSTTSGWLRPGQTPNSTATPTPPSTSPQPPLLESSSAPFQTIKPRSGNSPAPNGFQVFTGSQNNKQVWSKSTAASSHSVGRSLPGLDSKSDFPTAAEAVHSLQTLRKNKSVKGQTELDTAAAAHKTAQRNAMNETAAAFRGAHLDVNARWDEMSDEDSEDFDGVIEFGDGTQYKIEHKPNSSQDRPVTFSEPEGPVVTKEERFGEDMGRNWPRRAEPAVAQLSAHKPSLQLSVSSHTVSEAPSQIQSPHDGISPTSRALFNERLNRLEPLVESKVPFGSRQRDLTVSPQTYPSNIQLLQKGLPGTDFKSKGPSRGAGSGSDRSLWGDSAPRRGSHSVKSDERPWESKRRESMSSTAGSSTRDRSRGRESRWEPPPHHAIGTNRDHLQRTSNAPSLLPITRERDGNHTNYLHPSLAFPGSAEERGNIQSNVSSASPTISTQSLHSPVIEKLQSVVSQSTDVAEDIDKNVLLKSAMHLANERARRRKQELDEEEKRREEAAERARKKAEALAHAMDERQKPEIQNSSESQKQPKSDAQTEVKTATTTSTLPQQAGREQPVRRSSADNSLPTNVPSLLSRRPPTSFAAAQAESWRSKAPSKSATSEVSGMEENMETRTIQITSSVLPSSDNHVVSPFLLTSSNDFVIKPDEEVEVVDFEDLGKFLRNAPQEQHVLPKTFSKLSSRPVASDFFQEDSVSSEAKAEALPWRRSVNKPQLIASVDGLRTQTVPIFSTDLSPETELPAMDTKNNQSPLLSSSKRVEYNPQLSPVLSVLRSPRASHFKEAPMSALTDTMSRIKGALDGMQSQDVSTPFRDRPLIDKVKHSAHEAWRSSYGDAFQRYSSAPLTLEKLEELVSHPPPPPSPKPVWNTHTVKLPRIYQLREPLPKKQVHYWNLPYPPVRWDILSWDPPVEGMNKRDLSRDDIFHKKYNIPKGGKLRVVLPPDSQQTKILQTRSDSTPTTLVTAMGIKIKLPSGPLPYTASVFMESTQDVFNVSSCRRFTNSSKNEQHHIISTISSEGLNTTSRSPPPDPCISMPLLTPTRNKHPTSFEVSLAANVSLPCIDNKMFGKGPREPVSFLRAKGIGVKEKTSTLLPTFTVNSELEPPDQVVKVPITNSIPELSKADLKSLPSQTFTPTPHELPRLIASKPGSKSSDESVTRPGTPPSSTQHTTSPWGKALTFPVKESPTRRGPDPEHLKAVWSQPNSIPAGSTLNSLKGITDEQLPSIPSTMQDLKSEDGETPPPTAPAPPSRLSQQEVARAFQQVPESPASRPPVYPQSSLFPQYPPRPNHSMTLSHSIRPSYPPSYPPHAVMGHSPSPTLMYAPGVDSPVLHQRMPVNGPSPSVPSGVWLSTPPPASSQHGNYLRPAGAPPTPLVYPPPATAPNQMVPHRMALMGHGSIPQAPPTLQSGGLYAPVSMPDMRNLHVRSPHMAHTPPAHPHPHAVPMQTMQTMYPPMFSPPPPPPPGHAAQPQAMYAVPAGANRGAMVPRNVYEGYHTMPPHAGYPTTSYIFPS